MVQSDFLLSECNANHGERTTLNHLLMTASGRLTSTYHSQPCGHLRGLKARPHGRENAQRVDTVTNFVDEWRTRVEMTS